MGCAVGDFDNDGDPDLFVTAVGKNRLFRNDNGVFLDITDQAGVGGKETDWGSSCGWFDCDNDGDLDLWVCHYLNWSRELDLAKNFQLKVGGRGYGRPTDFLGTHSTLYLNEGSGKFRDTSKIAGLYISSREAILDAAGVKEPTPQGKGLGVVFVDINRDGKLDVVVANDTVQNFLFENKGRGKFSERAVSAGVAYDEEGRVRGAMGIDAGYFRPGETVLGICIGNYAKEMSALYVNHPSEPWQFSDHTKSTGLGSASAAEVRFGVFLFDADLDGRLDYFEANGQVENEVERLGEGDTFAQPAHLFWNTGQVSSSEFVRLSSTQCGEDLFRPIVGRGAIYADIDGDGDQDLLISTCTGKPRLLRNDQSLGNHWVRFHFIGTGKSNRDAIGTYVELFTEGQKLIQMVSPTKSYLSQVELPITFGLGAHTKIDRVEIRWPDGTRQKLAHVEIDRLHQIRQPVTDEATTKNQHDDVSAKSPKLLSG